MKAEEASLCLRTYPTAKCRPRLFISGPRRDRAAGIGETFLRDADDIKREADGPRPVMPTRNDGPGHDGCDGLAGAAPVAAKMDNARLGQGMGSERAEDLARAASVPEKTEASADGARGRATPRTPAGTRLFDGRAILCPFVDVDGRVDD